MTDSGLWLAAAKSFATAVSTAPLAHEAVKLLLITGAPKFPHIGIELLAHFIEFATFGLNALDLGLAPAIEGDIAALAEMSTHPIKSTGTASGKHTVHLAVGVSLEFPEPVTE